MSPVFDTLIHQARHQTGLRAAITAATLAPEPDCVAQLLLLARVDPAMRPEIRTLALRLVAHLRGKSGASGVEDLVQEYSLGSHEGVALMCLAEALLRIPDAETRDALIRDKIADGDWRAHLGHRRSLFVNAATWGLVVTRQLLATASEASLGATLTSLIGRWGEPVIRKAVDVAMRMLGEQFVAGQTIAEALSNSRRLQAAGFTYSYDMLGEAALTATDAERYFEQYAEATRTIGEAADGAGVYAGPGISIKLSALHPRYGRSTLDRVMAELLPRVMALAHLARRYDIGLNIDAEEAERLDISLDIFEALARDPALAGWNGLGFVVQAYGKRAPYVIDWIVDLARRARRRLMLRLVKGAYWDSEIKRAQVLGLQDFPVFTRKVHTDISYLACARKLLAAPDAIFPQFATHNAQTVAAIYHLAGPHFTRDQYEFQCLHGMGEPLYEEITPRGKLNRPCRIYAPVGAHETLLAYLVRRLLENGANSSFVNRIADAATPIADLVADPVDVAGRETPPGAPHPNIDAPSRLFGARRRNSRGLDLADELTLISLASTTVANEARRWTAFPFSADEPDGELVLNPAEHRDVVGYTRAATAQEIATTLARCHDAAAAWASTSVAARATMLIEASNELERRMEELTTLLMRESGKTFGNAVGEVREAVDFLRYYASEAIHIVDDEENEALGPIACISPWNFPLSIFLGQVSAALVAGNPVIAKPAEETPLIAAEAIRVLHRAGVPADVVQLAPGDGRIGAALVADPRVRGVVFTGSLVVARAINQQLSQRLGDGGRPIRLIAETGGVNAMIVDSSALPEQVVRDIIASAFDSAGQRCSALRLLCVQDDVADDIIGLLKGAMAELRVGNPAGLATDVGPVITAQARDSIDKYVAGRRRSGRPVSAIALADETAQGTYVAPTIIDVARVTDVQQEIFGPVLHIHRFARNALGAVVAEINAAGYGLTFGVHTRVDETVAHVVENIRAGNIYVNRNMIGAVVGVQPFGGNGLSGTGPKAGGPRYVPSLRRATNNAAGSHSRNPASSNLLLTAFVTWLESAGDIAIAARCRRFAIQLAHGVAIELPGPVGERNIYTAEPRGLIAMVAPSLPELKAQFGAIIATENSAIGSGAIVEQLRQLLPPRLAGRLATGDWFGHANLAGVLLYGPPEIILEHNGRMAHRDGAIFPLVALGERHLATGEDYDIGRLLDERVVSTNTAAAGGNAALLLVASD